MNALYKKYEMNKEAEQQGIWLNFGPVDENDPSKGQIRIRVARAGGSNERYHIMRAKLLEPFAMSLKVGQQLSEDDSKSVMTTLYARTIITEWENVSDREGNPLEFNEFNVKTLLNDLPELYAEIYRFVNNEKHYLEVLREVAAKN